MGLFTKDKAPELTPEAKAAEAFEVLAEQHEMTVSMLTERLAELELALDDEGWLRLGFEGARDFTNEGRKKIRRLARLMFLKNPLIKRAIRVTAFYTFGQGVEIGARDDAVDEVVQAFMDHPGNVAELFGAEVRTQRDIDLQADGEIFFVMFTNTSTGFVRLGSIDADQITDIICNPDNEKEPWYYKREWTHKTLNLSTGSTTDETRVAYYPDFRYRPLPGARAVSVGGKPVYWNNPIKHLKVGGFSNMKRGVPDVYAALDWAKAYKEFLEDEASIFRALSQFAYELSMDGRKITGAKSAMQSSVTVSDPLERNPRGPAGQMALTAQGHSKLEAVQKSGAYVKPEDGRHIRTMVAAGTDLPDTILAGDPDMGNLATAKTLDRPTELAMRDRQTKWTGTFRDLCDYAVNQAAVRPNGGLSATVRQEDSYQILDFGDTDRTIEVNWPPIVQDIQERVEAIVHAVTLDGKTAIDQFPPGLIARLLLTVLEVENIDDILNELFEEEGLFWKPEHEPEEPIDPNASPPEQDAMLEAVSALKVALRELKENA